MLFVYLLINYVSFTLRNVKYQFNIKYPNNINILQYVTLTLEHVKNST